MGFYTFQDNSGRFYQVHEPPLEPPDCWQEAPGETEEEGYDRGEDEMNGIFNRYRRDKIGS